MNTLESTMHSDPQILGGTPVFRGTRVPVKTLLDYLAANETLETFLTHFPGVSRTQAVNVLQHAETLLDAHAHSA